MPSSQDSLEFCPFKDIDFDEVVNLCVRKWCSDITGAYDRIIFGRVMTTAALQRSSLCYVAKCNGTVVGVCFAGIYRDRKIICDDSWRRRFEDVMIVARDRAKRGGVKVEERLFTRLRFYTMADVFVASGYANSEAEINLLIVDPRFAAQGIGTRLISDMEGRFRAACARGFFLLISADSDRAYFEHRGFNCIREKHTRDRARSQTSVYLYGKRL